MNCGIAKVRFFGSPEIYVFFSRNVEHRLREYKNVARNKNMPGRFYDLLRDTSLIPVLTMLEYTNSPEHLGHWRAVLKARYPSTGKKLGRPKTVRKPRRKSKILRSPTLQATLP